MVLIRFIDIYLVKCLTKLSNKNKTECYICLWTFNSKCTNCVPQYINFLFHSREVSLLSVSYFKFENLNVSVLMGSFVMLFLVDSIVPGVQLQVTKFKIYFKVLKQITFQDQITIQAPITIQEQFSDKEQVNIKVSIMASVKVSINITLRIKVQISNPNKSIFWSPKISRRVYHWKRPATCRCNDTIQIQTTIKFELI